MSSSQVDIVVVGAGAAGIGAARRLVGSGKSVRLLEARDRLGGRGFTRIDPEFGPLDLGCGWLHSGDVNPWTAIAEGAGHIVDRTPAPWTKPAMGPGFSAKESADFAHARDAFNRRLHALVAKATDAPASDALISGGRWNALLGAIYTFISGGQLEQISALDLANYADTGVNWRVAGGYGALIASYGAGLDAALDCPVSRIDHGGPRVRVETLRGTVEADQVIVTLPSALIADGAIRFSPELPDKREAAAGLPLGLDDKLYFALDRPDGFEADSRAFGRTDGVATAAYHIRPLGAPVIECYFGGQCAVELERAGEGAFADFAARELAGLFGSDVRQHLRPLPMHLWASDPLARGAYSYAAPGRVGDRSVLAEPVDGRLFFAGEACSTHDYSTAHGAYRTGVAAAEAALAARKP